MYQDTFKSHHFHHMLDVFGITKWCVHAQNQCLYFNSSFSFSNNGIIFIKIT